MNRNFTMVLQRVNTIENRLNDMYKGMLSLSMQIDALTSELNEVKNRSNEDNINNVKLIENNLETNDSNFDSNVNTKTKSIPEEIENENQTDNTQQTQTNEVKSNIQPSIKKLENYNENENNKKKFTKNIRVIR